ncbi:Raffinose synthase or seed imbibition protein Sip1 [Caldanaerobius fijiensis DSM 17918]|uniref:Raffinose synthase or seed imbibition protein Sip1 n=1 Tax=Caldanaerobius fijiensis DSM 17918 TaxID=1121256 RepID=A0A1M4SXG4_9THEO|nr:Sip1-related alpha-galactosidase [Caldanaerobius fijiensis]SHE36895.1 Raffinose synthase or seed imbibition protein Sip1 [Caldanaerobius fijiensis DSM 17918]
MFLIKNINGKVDIYLNESLVIKDIVPVVNLNHIQIVPELKAFDGNSYIYTDEDMGLTLKLTFDVIDQLILVSINSAVEKDVFAPVGGVILEIGEVKNVREAMALYLFKDWWTRPYFTNNLTELPERTQALTWTDGSIHYGILSVCSGNCKTDFAGKSGKLNAIVSTYDCGHNNYDTLSFVIGADENPYHLVHNMVEIVFSRLKVSGKPREERRLPDVFKYFGWCSWDAFYHDVNEKGIINKAEEFKKSNFPVKWFIIDDGWSEVKDGKLLSFEEDKNKFPSGLQSLSSRLKKEYGLNWLGVWHAFEGYWSGIHPDSLIAKEYKDNIYMTKRGSLLPYPDANKGFGFWNAWHSSLKEKGIDFVKVDNQSSLISFVKNNMDIARAAKGLHNALEASVGLNFEGAIINCMGMATEEVWNRPYSAVSRNSDDFFPKIENSFREHALQNVYNSFIMGHILWGDWDMFWTRHPQGINNAVLRAVSGGPVYISDEVGKTDFSVLWPLVYSDGEVLRCDMPGMPTRDCIYHNPQAEAVPLKIWNKAGQYGVIAAFNINTAGIEVKGTIKPSDVEGIDGEKFVLYEYFSKKIYILDRNQSLDITLQENGVQLYIVSPLNDGFAAIGNENKYISPAVIKSVSVSKEEVNIVCREAGSFGFVSLKEPSQVLVNGKKASVVRRGEVLYSIDCGEEKYSQINIYY